MHRDSPQLDDLLQQLRHVGREAPRELLDQILAHGHAAVPALIELATDRHLHSAEAKEPEVWAPVHAMRLLGEVEAAEAVEPLAPLLKLDDDWIREELPEILGRIGRPAIAPMRAMLLDTSHDVWTSAAAADALKEAGTRHPELRSEAIEALTAYLDRRDDTRDDVDSLYGLVVSYLCDLQATEALPSIRRAFHEDLVEQFMIRPEHVERALGRPIGVSVRQAVEDVLTGAPPRTTSPARSPFTPPVESTLSPLLGLKVGRNDPCTCGSGRKYKKCCGK